MKNIESFGKKWITLAVVLAMAVSAFAVLGGAFGAGAPPFTVTFEEHGLPAGTTWGIAWNNTTKSGAATNTTYSGGGSIAVPLYNASYEFKVQGTPWYFNSTVGKFTVAGSALTITVNFNSNISMNITESAETSNSWSIAINSLAYPGTVMGSGLQYINIKRAASNENTTIVFNNIESAGMGIYSEPKSYYIPLYRTLSGVFNTNFTYFMPYLPIWNVTFTETGLPAGSSWGIDFHGAINSTSGENKTILMNSSNGKPYTWSYPAFYQLKNDFVNTTGNSITFMTAGGEVNNLNFVDYSYQYWNLSYSLILPAKYAFHSANFNKSLVKSIDVNAPAIIGNSGQFSLNGNATINLYFAPTFAVTDVRGYTNPNTTIYYPSYLSSSVNYVNASSAGYYNINMTGYPILFFHKSGYVPYAVQIPANTNGTYWKNVTLKQISVTWNVSDIFKQYSNYTLFNMSNAPVNFTYSVNGTQIGKISQNEIYISSINPNNKPVNIILPVRKGAHYKLDEITNISSIPTVIKFNATSDFYNFSWNNWRWDPIIEYSSPEAVISSPSAVPYDTAVILSGASSIPSENATITNYTWHITGPVSYTEYGVSPSVFFSTTGIYTIKLTVTASDGLTNTTSTSLTVLASNVSSAIKISVSHTFNSKTSIYTFTVNVNMTNNVSISQITVSVDGKYVNITLTKQIGYDYYYTFNLSNARYGYGNHTIKIMVFDTLGQYNSLTTYLVFGSVSGVGIFSYIFTNTLLLVVTAFVILALLVFVYSVHERDETRKVKKGKRVRK